MSLTMLNSKDPEVLRALYAYRRKVFREGALGTKEKELIAMAVSSVLKCEKCLEYHAEAAKQAGATGDEILDALEVAMYMTGPSAMIWTDLIDEIVE